MNRLLQVLVPVSDDSLLETGRIRGLEMHLQASNRVVKAELESMQGQAV